MALRQWTPYTLTLPCIEIQQNCFWKHSVWCGIETGNMAKDSFTKNIDFPQNPLRLWHNVYARRSRKCIAFIAYTFIVCVFFFWSIQRTCIVYLLASFDPFCFFFHLSIHGRVIHHILNRLQELLCHWLNSNNDYVLPKGLIFSLRSFFSAALFHSLSHTLRLTRLYHAKKHATSNDVSEKRERKKIEQSVASQPEWKFIFDICTCRSEYCVFASADAFYMSIWFACSGCWWTNFQQEKKCIFFFSIYRNDDGKIQIEFIVLVGGEDGEKEKMLCKESYQCQNIFVWSILVL